MSFALACAALAVLELDAVLIAQSLVSRPLVVGFIMGALGGRAESGAFLGATFELLSLSDLPVGGCLTWSSSVSAGTATIRLCGGSSYPLCFAGGLLAGVLHSRVEAIERARRVAVGDALVLRAEVDERSLSRALGLSIAKHATMTFVISGAIVALSVFVDQHLWPRTPELFREGVTFAASSAPWIGLSGVVAWGVNRA